MLQRHSHSLISPLLSRTPSSLFVLCAALLAALGLCAPGPLSAQSVSVQGSAAVDFGPVEVGQSSTPSPIVFNFSGSVQVGSVEVLTQGASGKDFQANSQTTCTATTYSKGSSCTVTVEFGPLASGLRTGAVILYDTSSPANALATFYISGIGQGPQVVFGPGTENKTNLVGVGASSAAGVVMDGAGNLYVSDPTDGVVWKVSLTANGYGSSLSSVVTGVPYAEGIALDGAGNLYIAGNNEVLKVPWTGSGYGAPSTVGSIASGLLGPLGVAVDGGGNVYIADTYNNRVVEVPWTGSGYGAQSTIASGLAYPFGVAVDGGRNVYIADTYNNRVVKVPWTGSGYGVQSTIASGLTYPYGVVLDGSGNVYSVGYVQSTVSGWLAKVDVADPPAVIFATPTAVGTVDTIDGPQTVSVSNIGNQPLVFASNPSYPANFPANSADVNLCGTSSSLVPGASCDVSVNFQPTSDGANTGNVVLTDNNLNQTNATQTVPLSGTGLQTHVSTSTSMSASPTSVAYGQQITLTATVNGAQFNNASPTGTVTFSAGATQLGQASVTALANSSTAQATLTVSGTVLGAGSYNILAAYSGDSNYLSSSGNLSFTVNQATPVIMWSAPAAITYGTALSATQLNATANVPGTLVYTPTLGTVLGAGPQALSVSFTPTDSANYSTATAHASLTVLPAALTITANNASQVYGGAIPPLTFTATGFLNGDTLTSIGLNPVCSTNAAASSGVGTYSIVCSGPPSTANYNITYNGASLIIGKANASVTPTAASKTYGMADPIFTGTLSGFLPSDGVTATYSRAPGETVGSYTISATLGPVAVLGNYNITYNSAAFVINQAPLSVTANNAARQYGQANPTFTGTITGLQNGDNITATYSTNATPTSPVGIYTITPQTPLVDPNGKLPNYVVTVNNGTLAVNPAPLTVTANNASRPYGEANPVFTGTITGLVNGDNITATYSTSATPSSPVGSYPITPAVVDPGGRLGNYTVTLNNGTLTITQALTSTGVGTSPPIQAFYGQMITFTATVTDATSGSSGTPTGTVTFYDGGVAFGTSSLNASGQAAYSTFALPGGAGSHSITAVYSGDANFSGSTSGPMLQTITAAPVVSLDPDAITFHSEDVNTSSAPIPVVLTNQGDSTLTISGIQISGGNNGDFFIVANTCGNSLAALSSCTVSVVFSPQDTGTRTSSLSFTDNNDGIANSNQVISLTGSALSVDSTNFSRTPIAAGNTIWFDSVLSAKPPKGPDGILEMDLSNHTVNVYVTNGTITFTANNTTYNLPVPDAMITFTPTVTAATTTFDSVNNRWVTTVPSADLTKHLQQFDIPGEIFASGLAFPVPAGGLPGGISNVTWSAAFTTDTPGVTLRWEWGAAVYSTFTTNYNLLGVGVKSGDDGKGHCQWDGNGDRAGTPENFKQYLVMGATAYYPGDYTGEFTRDVGVVPAAMVVSIMPMPVVFAAPQAANTTSSAMTVTITNIHQSMSVAIANVAVNGDFAVTALSGSCPTGTTGFTLAPGNSCAFNVTFAPTDLGTRTGQLIFTLGAIAGMNPDDVPPPQKVDLVGTGAGGTAPIAGLSQLSLNFGNEEKGTTSAPQTVMLVNAGGAQLNISSIVPSSGDFTITSNTCGTSLAPTANCIVGVSFTPTTTGQRTGQLTFTYDNTNLSGLSQAVNLTGRGTP